MDKMPLSRILADNEFNCRDRVLAVEVRELAKNILDTKDLIQPIVLRKLPEHLKAANPGREWQIIAGYRRYGAYTLLAREDSYYSEIPYIVRECDDVAAFKMNLAENAQRKDLTIKEEARAVKRLLSLGLTQQQASDELGKSRGWLQIRMQLSDLPEEIQDVAVELKLNNTVITEIWQLPTAEARYDAVKKVKERREKGEKISTLKTKAVITAEDLAQSTKITRVPKDEEVSMMMGEIASIIGGYGFATRCIAWARGRVSNAEIIAEARAYAAERQTSPDV